MRGRERERGKAFSLRSLLVNVSFAFALVKCQQIVLNVVIKKIQKKKIPSNPNRPLVKF